MYVLCDLSVLLCASAVIRFRWGGGYFAGCVFNMSRKPCSVISFRSDVE